MQVLMMQVQVVFGSLHGTTEWDTWDIEKETELEVERKSETGAMCMLITVTNAPELKNPGFGMPLFFLLFETETGV